MIVSSLLKLLFVDKDVHMILTLSLKNIKHSFVEFKNIYPLMIISQLVATIGLLLMYGIFSCYHNKVQELDVDSYEISATVESATVGQIRECMPDILGPMQERLDYVFMVCFDTVPLSVHFEYCNDEFQLCRNVVKNCNVKDGRCLNEEDVRQKNKVVYSYTGKENEVGNNVLISGEKFEVVGLDSVNAGDYLIPITSCPESVSCYYITLYFNKLPTYQDYVLFKETIEEVLGKENVNIDEFQVRNEDELISMRSIMMLAIVVGIISALNTCLLYGYVLGNRRKLTTIYGIVGADKKKRFMIGETEIAIVTIMVSLFSFAIFKLLIVKMASRVYENFENFYNVKTYAVMLLLYNACTLIATSVLTLALNRKRLSDTLRRVSND